KFPSRAVGRRYWCSRCLTRMLASKGVRHSKPARCQRTRVTGMTSAPTPEIRLNGVRYRWPDRPVVVVCNDGGDPAYIDRALNDGSIPNVARFMKTGFNAIAECVIPSFNCPNNVWPRVDALDNYSGRVLAERCQGCIHHRKGQAAS